MTKRVCSLFLVGALACNTAPVPPTPALNRLHSESSALRDEQGRYVFFHGINVSGGTKNPELTVAGEPVYSNRPFPPADLDAQFSKLSASGFNAVRLLLSWEAIEPKQRGLYDLAYLSVVRETVKSAGEHGLWVLLDMHQDMFSRHLSVKFNEHPSYGEKGSVENTLLSLVQPYTDSVRGDGAPRWAVESCLQEKNLSSRFWGTPWILSGLSEAELKNLFNVYQKLTGGNDGGTGDGPLPDWVTHFALGLPENFAINETTDLLPLTHWYSAQSLSLDVSRCYACLFAGDVVFPGMSRDGENVKDYLQKGYAESWAQVAAQVSDLPNVLGYDLINEPGGNFIALSAVAGLIKAGVLDGAEQTLVDLFGPDLGKEIYQGLVAMRLLPPDSKPETLRLWGLDKLDALATLGLNSGFDQNYLRPFYEKVGKAILEVDPRAIIFIEGTSNGSDALGGLGGSGMTRPAGLPEVVYAPHWYPDVFPSLGFNQDPRTFAADELRFRNYQPAIEGAAALARQSLGNMPVVLGEFGAPFNLNGIGEARRSGYEVTATVLDTSYEALERMFQSQFVWGYTPDNTYARGDGWNHEDFSLFNPDQAPRAERAWNRPYARAMSGRPISTHFYSDYHPFDTVAGVPNPEREFEVRYGFRESSAPTEIFVPVLQYPEGFYVWLSDGEAWFDPSSSILFHSSSGESPGVEHVVRLLPVDAAAADSRWRYFFRGQHSVEHR